MKTLLVALGILASFGALFWLDRYYKDTPKDETGGETDGDDQEDTSESINN